MSEPPEQASVHGAEPAPAAETQAQPQPHSVPNNEANAKNSIEIEDAEDGETREAAAKIMADYHAQRTAMDVRQADLRSQQQEQLSAKLIARGKGKMKNSDTVKDAVEEEGAEVEVEVESSPEVEVEAIGGPSRAPVPASPKSALPLNAPPLASVINEDVAFNAKLLESACNTEYASLDEWKSTSHSRWNKKLRDALSLMVKEGPENKPFSYKYESRNIWMAVRDELVSFLPRSGTGDGDGHGTISVLNLNEGALSTKNGDQKREVFLAVGLLEVLIGSNYIECEENSTGQRYLEHAVLTLDRWMNTEEGAGAEAEAEVEAEVENDWTSLLPEGHGVIDGVPFASPWEHDHDQDDEQMRPSSESIRLAYLPAFLQGLSQIALLWAERADFGASEKFLVRAGHAYDAIKRLVDRGVQPAPRLLDTAVVAKGSEVVDVDTVVIDGDADADENRGKDDKDDKGNTKSLQRLYGVAGPRIPDEVHTHTLFYLGQLHMKRGETALASGVLYATLYRQLICDDFVPVEWAVNAMGMAGYFISVDELRQADIFVQAAREMLKTVDRAALVDNNEDEDVEAYDRALADINIVDGKIVLELLDSDVPVEEQAKRRKNTVGKKVLTFPMLQITPNVERFKPITGFEDARALYLEARARFDDALSFYVLDGFVSDHVNVYQHISQLFKHLAAYETDYKRRTAMHKRRLKLLEPLVEDLSEIHFFDIMRQMYYELGETQSAIASVLMEERTAANESKSKSKPKSMADTAKLLVRLGRHIEEGVSWFEKFIKTFNERKTGDEPTSFADDHLRPYLMAHFNIAHLSSRIVNPADSEAVRRGRVRALQHCEWIVRFADKPGTSNLNEVERVFGAELHVCREMARLLPLQLR